MKKTIFIMFTIIIILSFNIINGYAVDNHILITAHRGSSLYYPENTLTSIAKSIEENADYVEVDVRLTKDNKVVLFHDNTLKRVNGRNQSIEDMTLEEVKKVDNGSYKNKKYDYENIPTLEEVFENFKGKIKFNIELKMNNKKGYELSKEVSKLIKEYSMSQDVVVSSFNKLTIEKFKKDNKDIKTGYIISNPIDNIEKLECDFISIKYNLLSKELVEKIHENNKEIHIWTINDEEDIRKIIKLGVENIITDDVNLVKYILLGQCFHKLYIKNKLYRVLEKYLYKS